MLDSHPLVYLRLGGIKVDDFSAYLKKALRLSMKEKLMNMTLVICIIRMVKKLDWSQSEVFWSSAGSE